MSLYFRGLIEIWIFVVPAPPSSFAAHECIDDRLQMFVKWYDRFVAPLPPETIVKDILEDSIAAWCNFFAHFLFHQSALDINNFTSDVIATLNESVLFLTQN